MKLRTEFYRVRSIIQQQSRQRASRCDMLLIIACLRQGTPVLRLNLSHKVIDTIVCAELESLQLRTGTVEPKRVAKPQRPE